MKRLASLLIVGWLCGCAVSSRDASHDQGVIHASASDCEIIVEVGKAKLWGPKQSQATAFLVDYTLPNGGKYLEDCDWKKYGVNPNINKPDSHAYWHITRPAYKGDDASVEVGFAMTSRPGAPPYLSEDLCVVHKTNGRWKLVNCYGGAVT